MKYIVYLTTNLINGKIYIGVHKTKDPNIFDGYLGNGIFINSPKTYMHRTTAFQSAVAKYGPKNFKRVTLQIFNTEQEALDLENKLVNEQFIKNTDNYNSTIGGGVPPILNKYIYQYDLKGNFIKKWDSIKSITDYYSVNKDRIRMVINTKRSFNCSYWSEEYFKQLDTKEYRPSARGSIRQYTTEGIYLNTFKNTTEAANKLDIDRSKITNAICGKYSIEGYWFLKEDETIEEYLDGSIKKEKPVYCYNIDGSYNKMFQTISDIKKKLKINKPDLKRAIKNNLLLNNIYWSYEKYDNIIKENPELVTLTPKKVYQYTLNGEFVKEWNSINECKKEYPSVLQVLLGKRNHCHKFKFYYNKLKIQSDTISDDR